MAIKKHFDNKVGTITQKKHDTETNLLVKQNLFLNTRRIECYSSNDGIHGFFPFFEGTFYNERLKNDGFYKEFKSSILPQLKNIKLVKKDNELVETTIKFKRGEVIRYINAFYDVDSRKITAIKIRTQMESYMLGKKTDLQKEGCITIQKKDSFIPGFQTHYWVENNYSFLSYISAYFEKEDNYPNYHVVKEPSKFFLWVENKVDQLGSLLVKLGRILLILFLIFFPFIYYYYKSQIFYNGEIKLSKNIQDLTHEVKIYTDDEGQSHIKAEELNDGYFGLGFIHAKERLWQMDFLRRVARGKLSELFGRKTLPVDKMIRNLGFNELARKSSQYVTYNSKHIKLLNSYISGINYYSNNFILPVEYPITRSSWKNWELADSIAITNFMAFTLTHDFNMEVWYKVMEENLGKDFADLVLSFRDKNYPFADETIINDEELVDLGFHKTRKNSEEIIKQERKEAEVEAKRKKLQEEEQRRKNLENEEIKKKQEEDRKRQEEKEALEKREKLRENENKQKYIEKNAVNETKKSEDDQNKKKEEQRKSELEAKRKEQAKRKEDEEKSRLEEEKKAEIKKQEIENQRKKAAEEAKKRKATEENKIVEEAKRQKEEQNKSKAAKKQKESVEIKNKQESKELKKEQSAEVESSSMSLDDEDLDKAAYIPSSIQNDGASNSWIIDGKYTQSGFPLFSNDPHLTNSMPSVFFLSKLYLPDNTLVGATIPGFPFFVIGANKDISWGFTTENSDTADICEEKIDDNYYTYDGKKYHITETEEIINIKGEGQEMMNVRWTSNGPIITDSIPKELLVVNFEYKHDTPLSLRIAFFFFDFTGIDFYHALNFAKNSNDFLKEADKHIAPNLNLMWASKSEIGYTPIGKFPIKNYINRFCRGYSKEDAVIKFIPRIEVPKLINPKKGFLVSANNKFASFNYTYNMHGFHNHVRAFRIREMIENKLKSLEKFTLDDNLEMLRDLKDSLAERMLPKILEILERNNKQKMKYYTELKGWDFNLLKNSTLPTIWSVLEMNIGKQLLINRLSEEKSRGVITMLHFWNFVSAIIEKIHNGEKIDLKQCAHQSGNMNCEKYLIHVFSNLDKYLEEFKDSSGNVKQWGELKFNDYPHTPFDKIPILNKIFSRQVPTGGNRNTLKVARGAFNNDKGHFVSTHSPRFKMVCDMNEPTKPYMVLDSGNSGNIFSRFYDNMQSNSENTILTQIQDYDFEEVDRQRLITLLNF
jgi:acyl-homoserine lactone acylase PvdQ